MRWHRGMHSKMFLGGRLFQFGLLLIFVSSLLKLFLNHAFLEIMLLVGLATMLVGTLVTYTNSNNIKLEIVES